MTSITVAICKTNNLAGVNMTLEVPLNGKDSLLLLHVKRYCLTVFASCALSATTVNGLSDTDDKDFIYPFDDVSITLFDSTLRIQNETVAPGNSSTVSNIPSAAAPGNSSTVSNIPSAAAPGNSSTVSNIPSAAAPGNSSTVSNIPSAAAPGNSSTVSNIPSAAAPGNSSTVSNIPSAAAPGNSSTVSNIPSAAAPGNSSTVSNIPSAAAPGNSSPPFSSFSFAEAANFADWRQKNRIKILDCYARCIQQKNLTFKSIDLYNYFAESPQIAVLVRYASLVSTVNSNDLSKRLALQETEDRLVKALADLLHRAYPDYKVYTKNVNEFLAKMFEWLPFDVFQNWIDLSSNGRLQIVIKKRRHYHCQTTVTRKSLSTFPDVDQQCLDRLSTTLRQTTTETAEENLRNTVYLRRAWVFKINREALVDKRVATVFFQKFPIFMTKLELLNIDYFRIMLDSHRQVVDLEQTFKTFAPTVIYLAMTNSLDILYNENDVCLKALHALPSLLKKFVPRGQQQCFDHLYTDTNNLNINDALAKRITRTTCPSVVATNWENTKTFYVAVDDFVLPTPFTDFAKAMQRLHEVYTVLDLTYDSRVKDVFLLLESLMNMKVHPGVGIIKLQQVIEHAFRYPPEDLMDVLATASALPVNDARNSPSTANDSLTESTTEYAEENEIHEFAESQSTEFIEISTLGNRNQPAVPHGKRRSTASSRSSSTLSPTFTPTQRISVPKSRGLSQVTAKRWRG